jgi:transcription-repair coupling factor (superfamily II helicase)
MRDLEIRGAGNLLGGEQHGHMSRIGYDLYCKMIKETVDSSLGKKNVETPKATVEIKVDAYIPDDYIPAESVKFATYRRISDISDKESMLDMFDELKDRFGPLPQSVVNLLNIAYIRNLAGKTGVSVIKEDNKNTVLIYPLPDIEKITRTTGEFINKCFITSGKYFSVVLKTKDMTDSDRIAFIVQYLEFYENLLDS